MTASLFVHVFEFKLEKLSPPDIVSQTAKQYHSVVSPNKAKERDREVDHKLAHGKLLIMNGIG